MTSCPSNIQELAEEFLFHRLDDVTAQALCAHLSVCPDCAHEVDRERKLMLAIRETFAENPLRMIYKCNPVVIG